MAQGYTKTVKKVVPAVAVHSIIGCDGGCTSADTVRAFRLSLGSGSAAYLCRPCWAKEMTWRKRQNRSLDPKARYPIFPHPNSREGRARKSWPADMRGGLDD